MPSFKRLIHIFHPAFRTEHHLPMLTHDCVPIMSPIATLPVFEHPSSHARKTRAQKVSVCKHTLRGERGKTRGFFRHFLQEETAHRIVEKDESSGDNWRVSRWSNSERI
ncbi:hypothetical protein CEXT_118261 [Caerostris extrusa]|uniref:Uncharacterized protein n=1 Tax=Caerostris extrusa TaxID=172846 RepID=A0AAV4Y138_CAEEX|nr:hypothetical protein CEXT_118261 [Caerostris extrusa]